MSPSSLGPRGLFPLLSFYRKGGGIAAGQISPVCLPEKLGWDWAEHVSDTSDDFIGGWGRDMWCYLNG